MCHLLQSKRKYENFNMPNDYKFMVLDKEYELTIRENPMFSFKTYVFTHYKKWDWAYYSTEVKLLKKAQLTRNEKLSLSIKKIFRKFKRTFGV